jgi:hypothetical protein
MARIKVYARRYYMDPTFNPRTKTLKLAYQTVEGPLLNAAERTILTDAAKVVATGEVTVTSDDLMLTLELLITGVRNATEAALLARKVEHHASGGFLDAGISLGLSSDGKSVVTRVTD